MAEINCFYGLRAPMIIGMDKPDTPTADDVSHLALKARGARFEGCFFTASPPLASRHPVCRSRTPKRENCRFFSLVALAERANFRPCLGLGQLARHIQATSKAATLFKI